MYPILLTPAFWADRMALVIGGGPVAERKTVGLLAVGVAVRLIAPDLTPHLRELDRQGAIIWQARPWHAGDLALYPTALLVFAATNDPTVNAAIYEEAHATGRLVNLADDPARSDFILPGVVRRGPITLTVNTGDEGAAASPALTAHLRQQLEGVVGPEYAEFAPLLAALRPLVRERVRADRRGALWRRLVESSALELLRQGQPVAARQLLEDLVNEAVQNS